MFLLIPDSSGISSASCPDLHSNMFLLIQHQHTEIVHDLDKFTFQYVSINTGLRELVDGYKLKFTFQYVSINTCLPQRPF